MSEVKSIVVGLGTLNRPQMLRETLESLSKMTIPAGTKVEVVVGDNDPEQSAYAVVNAIKDQFRNCTIKYLQEPRRGIVYMRNTIMQYALDHATDLLAFIDDDEVVEEAWLQRMLETKAKYQADVVVGRVARILDDAAPRWVTYGRFFERPSIPTGTVRTAASTSNVLFDVQMIAKSMGLRFHPALNLSGSSDTFLFTQATEKGAKIVWNNEDLVSETIPASRMTVGWLLKRAFRHTNCRTLRARIKYPYYRAFITEGGYGILHFLLGVVSIPVNIFRGKAGLVHTLRYFWKGAGSFAGLSGFVYQEYEEIHGF